MQNIKKNISEIKERIRKAAEKCGRRPESIQLVAVSKTVPTDFIREAIEAGVTILGENYVQEARKKFSALSDYPTSWHFIGHLQSNKAKIAVQIFDLIHSVDSFKLARELDREAKKQSKVQSILIQINIAAEATKSGVNTTDAKKLITDISNLENIAIKGLMTMPPFFYNPLKARPYFDGLRQLRDQIQKDLIGQSGASHVSLNELSMGMTGDFEVAIDAGATLVRIGTAIFGDRN